MTAPAVVRHQRVSGGARVVRSSPVARRAVRRPVLLGPVGCASRPSVAGGTPRQLLVTFLVTLAVVGALGWLAQPESAGVPTETDVVRVGAGETVWDVAQRVAPQSDQRAVVERIYELNGMASSAVQPGQRLEVPSSS